MRRAGEGRQKSRGARTGTGLEITDLISSDFWAGGSRLRRPLSCLKARTLRLQLTSRVGGVGGAALHYFRNFPRLLEMISISRAPHNRASTGRFRTAKSRPTSTRWAAEVAFRAAPRRKRYGGRAASHTDAPMKTFRNGNVWTEGLRVGRHPHGAAAVGMNSTHSKAARPASTTLVARRLPDRSRLPTRSSPISATQGKARENSCELDGHRAC